ncbi:hypothetical protein PybrP1_010113, partial [[Pythium] brassicae (nom. inval.)]
MARISVATLSNHDKHPSNHWQQQLQPRVATYRNAYGTRFSCSSACYLALLAHLLVLGCVLALLLLVPVASGDGPKRRKQSSADAPPFVLWFGRDDRTGLIASAVVSVEPLKTYESIGVDTEDLLPPTPPSSPGRRGSIFANAPPPPVKRRATRAKGNVVVAAGEALSVSFGASETSFFASELAVASRADTALGVSELFGVPPSTEAGGAATSSLGSPTGGSGSSSSKKELAVRDIERRASIAQRAEKRKERAKSDISYENLRDEEIQMYEYLEFVRELLEGMAVKKVCQKSARVVKRTFFITKDMATVYWNKLGAKGWNSKKSSLDTSRIDKVLKGFHGNANVEAKGQAEKSALYVSVMCSDGKRLDLEAKDEAMRQRLYVGFSRLATEKRHEQQQQQQAGSQHVGSAQLQPQQQTEAEELERNQPNQRQEAPATLATPSSSEAPMHRLVAPEAVKSDAEPDEEEEKPLPPPPAYKDVVALDPTLRVAAAEDPETATEA